MSDTQTPSATWDAMSDEQKVEWLATNVMNWADADKGDEPFWHGWWLARTVGESCEKSLWNPLRDENHFHMLLEKVMEDDKLWEAYREEFLLDAATHTGLIEYMKASLETRCKALYLAYSSLNV